jgi:hypothetical protein
MPLASLTVMFQRVLLGAALAVSMTVAAASPPLAQTTVGRAVNPAIVPVDRRGERWWAERHNAVLAAVQAHPDTQLLLIGDSITNNYDKATLPDENFQPTWKQFYEPRLPQHGKPLHPDTNRERAAVAHHSRFNFMSEARIWYLKDPNQRLLPGDCQNMIVLSDEFYREILDHPIPTDLEAAKALSSSPAALDLFTWLSYRCFTARG